MKTRTSFVANSSSSSFVMLGAKHSVNLSVEKQKEALDRFGIEHSDEDFDIEDKFHDALYNNKFGFTAFHEPDVIGHVFVDDEYSLDDGSVCLEELADTAKETEEKIKDVLGIDVKLNLIFGTRCC